MRWLPRCADIPLRLALAWAITSLLALVLSTWLWPPPSIERGLVVIIFLVSVPLLAVAMGVSAAFSKEIARSPLQWTLAAIVFPAGVGLLVVGRFAFLSVLLSAPAGLLFLLSLKTWPPASAKRNGG